MAQKDENFLAKCRDNNLQIRSAIALCSNCITKCSERLEKIAASSKGETGLLIVWNGGSLIAITEMLKEAINDVILSHSAITALLTLTPFIVK